MRDLIDAWPPWSFRVALAHRDQHQSWLRGLFIAGEDRAPPASRSRDIELHAASEEGAVMAFRFATQKPLARNTFAA